GSGTAWCLPRAFVGVSRICHVLTSTGRADVACRLLLQEAFPSWGYSIIHGATTIWERWDGWTEHKGFQGVGMSSFNHYTLGSVGEWLRRGVSGIDADRPGYRQANLAPAIPADADARIVLPGTTGSWVTESGHSVDAADGVTSVEHRDATPSLPLARDRTPSRWHGEAGVNRGPRVHEGGGPRLPRA